MLRVRPKRRDRGTPERPAPKKRETAPAITKGSMQLRVVTFAMIVALLFAILAGRLWQLQILTGDDYTETAQQTQTREVKIPAQRGVVYDRDGEVLANNVPGLNVTVVPDEISREKIAELAEILEADKEAVLGRYDAALSEYTYNPYSPILVRENASHEAVTYISERTEEFPGLSVNDDWVRSYPQGTAAAHVLGYTGAITPEEMEMEGYGELPNDAVVGKSGVEFAYEEALRGQAGSREYSVDALGRVVTLRRADGTRADGQREVSPMLGAPESMTDPVPGKNLKLTLDMDLQKTAERELELALERARAEGYEASGGAVVAMDPRNGEILAMASRPEFDPQLFVGGISGTEEVETFNYLNSKQAGYPFSNRAITAGQPAASTFKVFTGIAGLASGVIDPYTTVTDTAVMDSMGCWVPAGSFGGCWRSWRQNSPNYAYLGDHGTQNFAEAIKDSNDIFFYQVADWIWNQTSDENWLPHFYEKFGFGSLTGIDMPGETAGRVPTRAGEAELMMALQGSVEQGHWTVGDWVNLSIGQGDLLTSPIQLARGYAAIQNGGTLVTPHVGKEISYQGKVEKEISTSTKEAGVDPSFYDTTVEGMRGVTERKGTAYSVFEDSELDVAGKSGTGETGDEDYVNWFVGWAVDREDPVVVVTMMENGGVFETGSEMTSGPVVRHVLEAYHGVEQSPRDQYVTDPEVIKARDQEAEEAKEARRKDRIDRADRTGDRAETRAGNRVR
ncbi:MAG: penicillin-binding protein 2 [Actinomycetota bacterium]|nr:penicillin-binding protein 2 [Actinomycetota bacterium]